MVSWSADSVILCVAECADAEVGVVVPYGVGWWWVFVLVHFGSGEFG
jgi:hypothetical protein